jgi:hypothetical protein
MSSRSSLIVVGCASIQECTLSRRHTKIHCLAEKPALTSEEASKSRPPLMGGLFAGLLAVVLDVLVTAHEWQVLLRLLRRER